MKRGRKPGSGEYDSQIRVRIPKDTIEQLKTISASTGLSVSETIRFLIEDYISKFEVNHF